MAANSFLLVDIGIAALHITAILFCQRLPLGTGLATTGTRRRWQARLRSVFAAVSS